MYEGHIDPTQKSLSKKTKGGCSPMVTRSICFAFIAESIEMGEQDERTGLDNQI